MRLFAFARATTVATAIYAFSSPAAIAADPPPDPPISNPAQLIDNVTVENITEIVREMGGQQIETRDVGNGQKLITFVDGAVPYNAGTVLCDYRPGKCLALAMAVVMDTGATTYSLDVLNAFNRDNLFLMLVKLEDGKIGFGRVTLVDGGVTKKNLAFSIAAFASTLQRGLQHLKSQLVAGVQQDGTFQAGLTVAEPRLVPATPADMAKMTAKLLKGYRATLGPAK